MNQEHTFSDNDVYNFIKLLVETGGVHYVDGNHCIFRVEDNTPVGVKIGNGKDSNKQIALFKEGCKPPPNAVYLNPFDELLGQHPERDWFMNIISIIPGCLILHSMKTMTDLINHKTKDTKFRAAEVLSKFVGRVDEKFATELQKIRPLDAGMIYYDKQKHIAQLLCDFWQEDFVEKMKSKIRKSSIVLIQDMTKELLGTDDTNEIMYTATVLACPKFDAVVHVLVDVLSRLSKSIEKLIKIDLHADELAEHLKHLEAYHKALQWLATSSASPVKSVSETDAKIASPTGIPWNVEVPGSSSNGGLGNVAPVVASPTAGFLSNVGPVGVTKNPNFNAGVTRNPTFGFGGGFAPVDPGIPGLGRVAPVIPSVAAPDFSKIAADAYTSMGYGTGFGGGFV